MKDLKRTAVILCLTFIHMSLVLIAGIASLGMLLNRNGRGTRLTPQQSSLPTRDRPHGRTIYDTNYTSQAHKMLQEMAQSRYPHPQTVSGINPFVPFDGSGPPGGPAGPSFISPLTGLTTDMSHGNMQPHFGPVKRQVSGLVDSTSTRTLEAFGVQGEASYLPERKERLNGQLIPQDRSKVLESDDPDRKERIANDLSVRRNDVSLPQSREVRNIGDNVRILPKVGDQLRALNNPMQAEYRNETLLPGKMGDARPLEPQRQEVRRDYYSSGNPRDNMPQLSNSSQQMLPQNLLFNQDRSRDAISNNRYGPAVSRNPMQAYDQKSAQRAVLNDRPDQKREFANSNIQRGAIPRVGKGSADIATTHVVSNTKRDKVTNRIQAPTSSISRGAIIGIMDVDYTSQELLLDRSQFIADHPTLPHSQTKRADVNFDLPATAREMNADLIRFGPGHTGLNLPATVQDYDLDLGIELLQDAPHYGNASSKVARPANEGEWTKDLDNRDHENRLPGGYAPIGQRNRESDYMLKPELNRQLTDLRGAGNANLGGTRRTPFQATLKDDIQLNAASRENRHLPNKNQNPAYPLITRTSEKEVLDNRICAPRPDGTAAREYGRLRQIL